MNISNLSWFEVEDYLGRDDRAVVPLGSTEQHAYLSLCVDNILSERVASEAAEPLGVPVFPVLNYGLTPYFMAYPGTVTLRLSTYQAVLKDILDSLKITGFKRVLFVNGHGGNNPGSAAATEWMLDNPDVQVRWHNWWNAPKTWAKVQSIDSEGSHASWMENFAWTRLPNQNPPSEAKAMVDADRMRSLPPRAVRDLLGDGNLGGVYTKPEAVMEDLWQTGVEETRTAIEGPWD